MLRTLRLSLATLAMLATLAGCKNREVTPPPPAAEPSAATPAPAASAQGEPRLRDVLSSSQEAPPALSLAGDALSAEDRARFESWFKKHDLDPAKTGIFDEDADGDGISNGDEFLADTNPVDKASMPGIHKVMRLREYTEVRLPVVLTGVEGDTAELRRLDAATEPPQKVKVGQQIAGMPYRLERVESRPERDKDGNPYELTSVTLSNPDSKERIVLMKDLPARTSGSHAVLTSADGATSVTVKEGETFKWPGEEGASDQVIDLREDQVVVQDVETRKMWTIQSG